MNPRFHVLLVTQAVGGVATHIEHIIRFSQDRFQFTLIAPPSALTANARKLGVEVVEYDFKREVNLFTDFAAAFFLWKWCRNNSYEVYHYHSSKAGAYGRIVAPLLNRTSRTLYTPHAISFLGFRGMRRTIFLALERLLSRVGTIVAVSQSEKVTLERFLPHAHVALAWCGVVSDEFKVQEATSREDGEMRLVFSGRLNYQKNPEMFLRVALRLLKMFPQLRVHMIGAGYHDSESKNLRARVAESGFGSRVSILDWLPAEENREILQSATVVVLTSRFESFGYVVAEAMGMQIPVVATNVDGFSDLIIDGKTGFLVAVDDDDSMVEYVSKLLRSPALRIELGRNGSERIKEHFEARAGVSELSRIYLSL